MIPTDKFRKLALSFTGVIEMPHFEKMSFRTGKKIFATLDEKKNIAMLKLTRIDQSVFSDISNGAVFPVPGGWGKQGATYFDLKKVPLKLLRDAMICSHNLVSAKK